jgi:hypothetical protein
MRARKQWDKLRQEAALLSIAEEEGVAVVVVEGVAVVVVEGVVVEWWESTSVKR